MLALRTQALVPAGYRQKTDIVFTHWAPGGLLGSIFAGYVPLAS